MAHWRDDLVAFVLGCSFSFRGGADGGRSADPPQSSCKVRVPMYRTNIECKPSGPFAGPWWCRMRPSSRRTPSARCRSLSRFPAVHARRFIWAIRISIGIKDITKPDYGDAVPVEADEISRVLGLRRDPAGGDRGSKIAFADHARAGIDAGDGIWRNKQLAVALRRPTSISDLVSCTRGLVPGIHVFLS